MKFFNIDSSLKVRKEVEYQADTKISGTFNWITCRSQLVSHILFPPPNLLILREHLKSVGTIILCHVPDFLPKPRRKPASSDAKIRCFCPSSRYMTSKRSQGVEKSEEAGVKWIEHTLGNAGSPLASCSTNWKARKGWKTPALASFLDIFFNFLLGCMTLVAWLE